LTHKPAAFLSYVHFDDEHERGKITEFRKRLSAEVRMQTGEDFSIFQDKDLAWGENWKKRIEKSLDATTFFIPIITPGFFNSEPCLDELERFLEREKQLGSEELVLPVYYVESSLISQQSEGSTRKEKLARVISSRQYFDWRELRFDPMTSAVVTKTMAQLAYQIGVALRRTQPPASFEKPEEGKRDKSVSGDSVLFGGVTAAASAHEPISASAETPTKVASKTEPPTRVVDPMHRADYTTITAAIQAANPGDRILVRRGLYEEGITIDKPLEIIGDALPGEVVLRAVGKHVVAFKTSMGRIANLTLRQAGGEEWYGVEVAQGRLEIEDCDITSASLACVAVSSGSDPRLRRNRIHDSKQCGVVVYENGQGTFEDNDIFSNALVGVEIRSGGNPTFRRNRIHDGKTGGVLVYENAQGTFEDNDIFSNVLAGVSVATGGNPILRRNRIRDGKASGLLIDENGQGTFEDNDISGNAKAGVSVRLGGNPTLRNNRINANSYEGIWIYSKGGGAFEGNDLRENVRGAWDISADSAKKVKRSGNIDE
jgi:parallel beta-helix repeat protein